METSTMYGVATLQTSLPWHTTAHGIVLLRYRGRQDEMPSQLINRLVRNPAHTYCGNAAVDDVINRRLSRSHGCYLVTAPERGERRILLVGQDGRIREVPEKSFKFTRVSWTVLVAQRR